jgi:hypothetical protein
MSEESYIKKIGPDGGTFFVGPDAIALYRAITLRAALRLYAQSGMLMTRGMTPTKLLRHASTYTGKVYGRGNVNKCQAAVKEMDEWIAAMRAALPVLDKEGNPIVAG